MQERLRSILDQRDYRPEWPGPRRGCSEGCVTSTARLVSSAWNKRASLTKMHPMTGSSPSGCPPGRYWGTRLRSCGRWSCRWLRRTGPRRWRFAVRRSRCTGRRRRCGCGDDGSRRRPAPPERSLQTFAHPPVARTSPGHPGGDRPTADTTGHRSRRHTPAYRQCSPAGTRCGRPPNRPSRVGPAPMRQFLVPVRRITWRRLQIHTSRKSGPDRQYRRVSLADMPPRFVVSMLNCCMRANRAKLFTPNFV